MIEFYKNYNDGNVITDIDIVFNSISYELQLDDNDIDYMKNVDNAVYDSNGYVITPYGKTQMRNLSTGCKTLILINHSEEIRKNAVISIDGCGKNVLDIVFSMKKCKIYASYRQSPTRLDTSKRIKLITDAEEKTVNITELFN